MILPLLYQKQFIVYWLSLKHYDVWQGPWLCWVESRSIDTTVWSWISLFVFGIFGRVWIAYLCGFLSIRKKRKHKSRSMWEWLRYFLHLYAFISFHFTFKRYGTIKVYNTYLTRPNGAWLYLLELIYAKKYVGSNYLHPQSKVLPDLLS